MQSSRAVNSHASPQDLRQIHHRRKWSCFAAATIVLSLSPSLPPAVSIPWHLAVLWLGDMGDIHVSGGCGRCAWLKVQWWLFDCMDFDWSVVAVVPFGRYKSWQASCKTMKNALEQNSYSL
nr:hypothetical protein Itr_chr14CG18840 [Ipomoea trifida]